MQVLQKCLQPCEHLLERERPLLSTRVQTCLLNHDASTAKMFLSSSTFLSRSITGKCGRPITTALGVFVLINIFIFLLLQSPVSVWRIRLSLIITLY